MIAFSLLYEHIMMMTTVKAIETNVTLLHFRHIYQYTYLYIYQRNKTMPS